MLSAAAAVVLVWLLVAGVFTRSPVAEGPTRVYRPASTSSAAGPSSEGEAPQAPGGVVAGPGISEVEQRAVPTTTQRAGCPELGNPRRIAVGELPDEAIEVLRLVEEGGPFPYSKDGDVFSNRERLLPRQDRGYYREYTVQTPGSDDRGARRIVTGECGERWYTDDHYDSFALVEGAL